MVEKLKQFKERNATRIRQAMGLGFIAALAALWLAVPESALAGSADDGEFDDIWETLEAWTQGTLGRIIALTIIVVGIVMGIARQSLLAFAVGIAGGMGLYNAPLVVENIMGATLPM